MTDFSQNLEISIGYNFGELTPAKSRKLILTELKNNVNVIVQNEIEKHLSSIL